MESSLAFITISLALGFGVLANIFAELLKIPSIFLLLLFGIMLGPAYLNLVRPETLGDSLPIIVELGVAIILFEGGLSLRPDSFKLISAPLKRLLTLGSLISFVGGTLAAYFIVPLPGRYALIFGALMIITGPTVIAPILKRLPLEPRIANLLNWESILLDPVGASLAILIADFILAESVSPWLTALQFFKIIGVGLGIGASCGLLLQLFLKKSPTLSQENRNLSILAMALLSFAVANYFAHSSGLLAVVVAGIILARGAPKYQEAIIEFKGTLASLWIGFLFVLLAARLDLAGVISFGWRGVLFLVVFLLVVRPINIFVSMRGTELSLREKIFLSWIAPRGIVAASTASLFSLVFMQKGLPDPRVFENIVYLVIITTVVMQGLSAGIVARLLGLFAKQKRGVLIIGAHSLARAVALYLKEKKYQVKLIDTNIEEIGLSRQLGLESYHGNALDPAFLENLQIRGVGLCLALTSNDKVNFLACQLGEKLLGKGICYQLEPRHSSKTQTLMGETLGGSFILPSLPLLETVTEGLQSQEYTWIEVKLNEEVLYEKAILYENREFWPLFSLAGENLQALSYKQRLKANITLAGIMKL